LEIFASSRVQAWTRGSCDTTNGIAAFGARSPIRLINTGSELKGVGNGQSTAAAVEESHTAL
jgi:hypothetical protein